MQEAELVEEMSQPTQELSRQRTVLLGTVLSNRLALQDISRVDDVAVVFDQVHFISQQVNVGVQELDE